MTRILNEKWLTKVDFSKGVIELTEWEEKIYQQGRAEAIEEVHKLICDYLYSNNIHLIKIAKDEADTPIYPYKMADDIYEQLKGE